MGSYIPHSYAPSFICPSFIRSPFKNATPFDSSKIVVKRKRLFNYRNCSWFQSITPPCALIGNVYVYLAYCLLQVAWIGLIDSLPDFSVVNLNNFIMRIVHPPNAYQDISTQHINISTHQHIFLVYILIIYDECGVQFERSWNRGGDFFFSRLNQRSKLVVECVVNTSNERRLVSTSWYGFKIHRTVLMSQRRVVSHIFSFHITC